MASFSLSVCIQSVKLGDFVTGCTAEFSVWGSGSSTYGPTTSPWPTIWRVVVSLGEHISLDIVLLYVTARLSNLRRCSTDGGGHLAVLLWHNDQVMPTHGSISRETVCPIYKLCGGTANGWGSYWSGLTLYTIHSHKKGLAFCYTRILSTDLLSWLLFSVRIPL